MKRVGNIMPLVVNPDNLREAFLRTMRGKAMSREAQTFRLDLDRQLQAIAAGLAGGTYDFGHYRTFQVYDPKPRTICAAPFGMRVALHALMRVCHPVFDAYQPASSYACRIGRGSLAAVHRAQQLAARYRWFVKLDVVKYFDSIRHDTLLAQLDRLFKDKVLMQTFSRLLDSYHTTEGAGLPIGNLTSQYFANHYLAVCDHYAASHLACGPMVRYMDDVTIFGNDASHVSALADGYTAVAGGQLGLRMHNPVMNLTAHGLPFLGYVIHPHRLTLSQRSRHRLRRRIPSLSRRYECGIIDGRTARNSAAAMLAFAGHADGYQECLRRVLAPTV